MCPVIILLVHFHDWVIYSFMESDRYLVLLALLFVGRKVGGCEAPSASNFSADI